LLQLTIEDVVALGPDAQWEEDELSGSDEDSLAGQIALMKDGAVKGDEDSNDGDESDSVVNPTFPAVNDQKCSPPEIILEHLDFIKCVPNRSGNALCSSSRYSAGSRFHFFVVRKS
jgi:hypothetical protein